MCNVCDGWVIIMGMVLALALGLVLIFVWVLYGFCMGFVWVLYGDLGFCMGWRAWPGARTGFPPWFGGPSPDGSCKQVKQKKERKK